MAVTLKADRDISASYTEYLAIGTLQQCKSNDPEVYVLTLDTAGRIHVSRKYVQSTHTHREREREERRRHKYNSTGQRKDKEASLDHGITRRRNPAHDV